MSGASSQAKSRYPTRARAAGSEAHFGAWHAQSIWDLLEELLRLTPPGELAFATTMSGTSSIAAAVTGGRLPGPERLRLRIRMRGLLGRGRELARIEHDHAQVILDQRGVDGRERAAGPAAVVSIVASECSVAAGFA